MYKERFYREWIKTEDLFKKRVIVEETDLFISTSKKIESKVIEEIVKKYRDKIKNYIKKNKNFLTSLSPIEMEKDIAPILRDMISFSQILNVGPFACVAGAIAQYVGEELLKFSREVIIENGGDLYLKIEVPRKVGVVFYKGGIEEIIRLEIKPQDTPLGISSSSSRIGHSLSLGNVDLVCIVAESAVLSDGAATLLGNMVRRKKDIPGAISRLKKIKGIKAGIVVFENDISIWGDLEII